MRRVQVEDDRTARLRLGIEEQRHGQALDRLGIVANLAIARRVISARQLQPIERRFARQRRTVLAPGGELAGQHRQDRVVPQLVVVVEILVAERQPEDPLADQRLDRMLDRLRYPRIAEASGELPDDPGRPARLPKQQCAGIGADHAAVEFAHHFATVDGSKLERILDTLCRHRGSPSHQFKSLSQNNFR